MTEHGKKGRRVAGEGTWRKKGKKGILLNPNKTTLFYLLFFLNFIF
jgi:hypothetical protein